MYPELLTDLFDPKTMFTLAVLLGLLTSLVAGLARPAVLFVLAMMLLLIPGIIAPADVVAGFSGSTVQTVGALFLVAGCIQHVGLLSGLDRLLRNGTGGTGRLLFHVMGSTAAMSSVLNNTPIVAIMYPHLVQWAGKFGVSPSKLLIPLSYAAIVGGLITLFGTSTNLIVSGMLADQGVAPFHFFQLAAIGLPASVLVILWFSLVGHRWLPDRPAAAWVAAITRERSKISNYWIQKVIPGPSGVYYPGGSLAFAGLASASFLEEQAVALPSGVYVRPAGTQNPGGHKPGTSAGTQNPGGHRRAASVYSQNPGRHKPETSVGTLHGAAARTTNLLVHQFRLVKGSQLLTHRLPKIWTLVVTLAIVALSVSGVYPTHMVVLFGAAILLATGMLPIKKVYHSIHFSVLVVIAASLAIGASLESTGLASTASSLLVQQTSQWGTIVVLVALYLTTNLLTELLTNNAAAVFMVPIALYVAQAVGLEPQAAGMTVAVAASASFLSPVGYQTNLMVMEPGGYRYTDFTKAGLPVTLILMFVTITMVCWLWT